MPKSGLLVLRRKIDRIDKKLTGLLVKRYECISSIGRYKIEKKMSVADPERETAVIEKVTRRIPDENAARFVKQVYSGIFDASRAVETNETV